MPRKGYRRICFTRKCELCNVTNSLFLYSCTCIICDKSFCLGNITNKNCYFVHIKSHKEELEKFHKLNMQVLDDLEKTYQMYWRHQLYCKYAVP
jgi:hypothetical protein